MNEDHKYFAHSSSYIDDNVEIGEGTKIWYFCHVLGGSKIGTKCIIGQNCMIGPDVTIGNRCKFQNNISVYTGVTIEEEVFCGPSCVFTNVYNPRAFIERKQEFRPTLVKRGATIGANATILCGSTIGRYAMIGAGSMIRSDVPDYAIMVGIPARQVGWVCKCGTTLRGNGKTNAAKGKGQRAKGTTTLKCTHCGNEYALDNGQFAILKEA
ncbi:MAG: acyltransferase [Syntrophales bacterium]|jgi:UDP-2-acetamido-3-amino-2,3-dideoxy-glucuronate N-acetyltransferase